jgi:hypothetical protein
MESRQIKSLSSSLGNVRNTQLHHFIEKLQGVFECYEYYMKAYNPNPTLNEDEFDDVFSSLLNDCQAYFKLLEDREMK